MFPAILPLVPLFAGQNIYGRGWMGVDTQMWVKGVPVCHYGCTQKARPQSPIYVPGVK